MDGLVLFWVIFLCELLCVCVMFFCLLGFFCFCEFWLKCLDFCGLFWFVVGCCE